MHNTSQNTPHTNPQTHSSPPQSNAARRREDFKRSTIENRDGIGMAAAVIATWLITDIGKFVIPAEVMSAFQYLLGAVVARIRSF